MQLNDIVGMDVDEDADDDETEPSSHKRVRKESDLALKKLQKDDPHAKLKKKARVLVEVMMIIFVSFSLLLANYF